MSLQRSAIPPPPACLLKAVPVPQPGLMPDERAQGYLKLDSVVLKGQLERRRKEGLSDVSAPARAMEAKRFEQP